jgi:hypothetical protein
MMSVAMLARGETIVPAGLPQEWTIPANCRGAAPSYKEAWMRLGRPGGLIPGVHGFLLSNR